VSEGSSCADATVNGWTWTIIPMIHPVVHFNT
jgi:hypothetical protein